MFSCDIQDEKHNNNSIIQYLSTIISNLLVELNL